MGKDVQDISGTVGNGASHIFGEIFVGDSVGGHIGLLLHDRILLIVEQGLDPSTNLVIDGEFCTPEVKIFTSTLLDVFDLVLIKSKRLTANPRLVLLKPSFIRFLSASIPNATKTLTSL